MNFKSVATEIQNFLLPYGSLAPQGHDRYGSQNTGNGSHSLMFLFTENFKMRPQVTGTCSACSW